MAAPKVRTAPACAKAGGVTMRPIEFVAQAGPRAVRIGSNLLAGSDQRWKVATYEGPQGGALGTWSYWRRGQWSSEPQWLHWTQLPAALEAIARAG